MAKKEKVVDLKPKAEKISDEQLKNLQNVVNDINQVQYQIGRIEAQKHNMLHGMVENQNKLLEIQQEFQNDYGTFDINIADGTINYKEDEQADKKD